MMASDQAIQEVVEILEPANFYRPLHQDIFRILVTMSAAQEPISPVTLCAWLERENIKFEHTYIADLCGIPIPAMQAAAHARLVWDCAVRRTLAAAGMR